MSDHFEQARRLGGFAARRGQPITACPFPADGTGRDQAMAASWLRGFLHWRPDLAEQAIDHSARR